MHDAGETPKTTLTRLNHQNYTGKNIPTIYTLASPLQEAKHKKTEQTDKPGKTFS